jgi:hypothetical protein
MNKLYLTLFALVISTMTFAQTTMLSEGFEGQQFPPSGWSRETINMSMYTWFRGSALYTTDWWGIQYHVVPPEGMRMAALESDLNEEWGPQDESLITPMIAVERPAVLTFETFCQYGHPEYRDHYEVDVLDATGSWNTLWDGAEQPTVWLNQFEEPVSIDLSPYQGQSIKIRFRGYNDAGEVLTYSWFIDNVKVIATDTIPDSVNETAFQASIYPNPVNQMMTVKSANEIQRISIHNLLGVKVKEFIVNDMEAVIDLSELTTGMYLITLWSDKNQPYIKIINKL